MSTATGQAQDDGYWAELLRIAEAREDNPQYRSYIMRAGGYKVGERVSAVELEAFLEAEGLASYIHPQSMSAAWAWLIESGYIKHVKGGNGRWLKIKSPAIDSGNADHDVWVYYIAKVFRTEDEWDAHRAALAARDARIASYTEQRARETGRVRAARGLGSSKLKAFS